MSDTLSGALPKTRIFRGKRYRLHESYLKYYQAEMEVRKLKGKGWKAGIWKVLGLHVVYKRR